MRLHDFTPVPLVQDAWLKVNKESLENGILDERTASL
jgi:hypothetical protein